MLICGIDEAGRGPVIGPLVIAGVAIKETQLENLKSLGVKDSKLLSSKQREELFIKIIEKVQSYHIVTVQPQQVDAALESQTLNLNWLEAQKSAEIINKLSPGHAIVDGPSRNLPAYTQYLSRLVNAVTLQVEYKADVNHAVCSAASILAKVTRDAAMADLSTQLNVNLGSGYMTDPVTQKYLQENYSTSSPIFRHSWAPCKELASAKLQSSLSQFQ